MNGYIIGGFSAVIVLLGIALGGFYLYSDSLSSKLKTAEVELSSAREKIKTQEETIVKMQDDAQKQIDLYKEYQLTVDEIRNQTFNDLYEITQTDYGKAANTNAAELEKLVNDRTKKILDSITEATKGQ